MPFGVKTKIHIFLNFDKNAFFGQTLFPCNNDEWLFFPSVVLVRSPSQKTLRGS